MDSFNGSFLLLKQDDPFQSCSNIVDVSSYEELKAAIAEGKWARGPWSAR
jgi:hypothetical protein